MCHLAIHYHPACQHVSTTTRTLCASAPCPDGQTISKVVPLPEDQVCAICDDEKQAVFEVGLIAAIRVSVDDVLAEQEREEATTAHLQDLLAQEAKYDAEWEAWWREREG